MASLACLCLLVVAGLVSVARASPPLCSPQTDPFGPTWASAPYNVTEVAANAELTIRFLYLLGKDTDLAAWQTLCQHGGVRWTSPWYLREEVSLLPLVEAIRGQLGDRFLVLSPYRRAHVKWSTLRRLSLLRESRWRFFDQYHRLVVELPDSAPRIELSERKGVNLMVHSAEAPAAPTYERFWYRQYKGVLNVTRCRVTYRDETQEWTECPPVLQWWDWGSSDESDPPLYLTDWGRGYVWWPEDAYLYAKCPHFVMTKRGSQCHGDHPLE
jgi:hypothetical protein